MEDGTGWHRKWVLLAIVLGWAFLYRFRLMGLLVARTLSYHLTKSRGTKINVCVERVTLNPLQLVNVELCCDEGTSWRVVFTRVTVQSHVRAFFESFGLVKICVLDIAEVRGDMANLDEELVARLLAPSRMAPENAAKVMESSTADVMSSSAKMNPICFMRFVDVRVGKINLEGSCLEVTTRVQCQDLYVGITDVFVKQDLLSLKVEVASASVHSFLQTNSTNSSQQNGAVVGLRMDLATGSAVLDLELASHHFLGCKVFGNKQDTTTCQVSTAFMEMVLEKRNELFKKMYVGAHKTTAMHDCLRGYTGSAGSSTSPTTASSLEITDFYFSIVVVDDVETIGRVEVQFYGEVQKFYMSKQLSALNSADSSVQQSHGDESDTRYGDSRLYVEATLENMHVAALGATEKRLLSVSSLALEAKQSHSDRGHAECTLGSMQCYMNNSTEKIYRSLVAVQGRVHELQNEARRVTNTSTRSRMGTPGQRWSAAKQPVRIHWVLQINIESWVLSVNVNSELGERQGLAVDGLATTVQTCIPLGRDEQDVSHNKHHIVTRRIEMEVTVSEAKTHTATFWGSDVTVVDARNTPTQTSSKQASAKFDYASVNGLWRENALDTQHCPAVYLFDMAIEWEEKVSLESIEVATSVHVTDTNVKWNFLQHKDLLADWSVMKDIANRSMQMLSVFASPKGARLENNEAVVDHRVDQDPLKVTSFNLQSKNTLLCLNDIPDVMSAAVFNLTDTRVDHKSTHLAITNTFNCEKGSLSWGTPASIIDVTEASFLKRSVTGRQRYLVKSPIQCDIRLSTARFRLLPGNHLLLLVKHFEQLANATSGGIAPTTSARKVPTQGMSFSCTKLCIELGADRSVNSGGGEGGDDNEDAREAKSIMKIDEKREKKDGFTDMDEQMASIVLESFSTNLTQHNPSEITGDVTRLAESTGRGGVTGRTFSEVLDQIMALEGIASATAIRIGQPLDEVATFEDTEFHFMVTDALWGQLVTPVDVASRTVSIDLCVLTQQSELLLDKRSVASVLHLIPAVQEVFATSALTSGEPVSSEIKKPSPQVQYVGNFDVAFQHSEIVCPYANKLATQLKTSSHAVENKRMRVVLGEVALNLRQFQKLAFGCASMRLVLEDASLPDTKEGEPGIAEPARDVLFVPTININAIIHWMGDVSSNSRKFSLSLDMSMRSNPSAKKPPAIPISGEALATLNWDLVFPWLVYLTTGNEENPRSEGFDLPSLPESESASNNHWQCVGVKWTVSVDTLQVAWWDECTQDIGLLILANDFLSHGVVKADTSSCEMEVQPKDEEDWILWEATIYLDLLRGYILHESAAGDKDESPKAASCDSLPFNAEKPSNYFVEAVGTSYRISYTASETEDMSAMEEEIEALFAPSTAVIFEKMHQDFVPIDYEYSLFGCSTPRKQNSPPRVLSVQIPLSPRLSPASSSPTKPGSSSPRSAKNWTQSVRGKLARLKRRSASMDNLLLNDGSCPIQIDAMKFLWSIQTRDIVFHIVAVVVDSVQLLLRAQQPNLDDGSLGGDGMSPKPNSEKKKRSSFRAATPASTDPNKETSSQDTGVPPAEIRRGSTRDTLLELLNQGKLGMERDAFPDGESPRKASDAEDKCASGIPDSDASPPAVIATKTYTLDVHNAQINVREDNTRSNVLVASKHIHFEIGVDAEEKDTIANMTFESVTAHVAPIDVDISAGVLWYSQTSDGGSSTVSPRERLPPAPGSTLLKQIMEECSLSTTYVHTMATDATSTEVDLSFLRLSTDRHQFYQLLNVIRHVLLAPPTVTKRVKRAQHKGSAAEMPQPEGADITVFMPNSLNPSPTTYSTKKLHTLLVEELRNREIRKRGTATRSNRSMTTLKAISFRVVGMQMRLRLSPETTGAEHEFVEIRVQGVAGCHTYFTNHCTKLTLNVQWLEVNNLHPGPSSVAFDDAMSVLKAKLLVNKRYESSSKVNLGNQKGMLMVRAESGPIVRVLGQKLRVLDVLEVSMFPEISNMIVIQLAADFYELLYKFFFAELAQRDSHDANSEHVLFGRKQTSVSSSTAPSSSSIVSAHKGAISPYLRARMPATSLLPLQITSSPLPLRKSSSAGSSAVFFPETSGSSRGSEVTSPVATYGSRDVVPLEDSDTETDNCELFYFKYIRIGNVRLRINCNGFFVNLSDFDLDLPPYVCQSKLYTWKKLLQKFESHLKWHITRESASSGLSQFKNKFLKWTPTPMSPGDKKSKGKKQEDDTATTNAHVLFGPYSGAPS